MLTSMSYQMIEIYFFTYTKKSLKITNNLNELLSWKKILCNYVPSHGADGFWFLNLAFLYLISFSWNFEIFFCSCIFFKLDVVNLWSISCLIQLLWLVKEKLSSYSSTTYASLKTWYHEYTSLHLRTLGIGNSSQTKRLFQSAPAKLAEEYQNILYLSLIIKIGLNFSLYAGA